MSKENRELESFDDNAEPYEKKPFDGLHTLREGTERKLLSLLGLAARARKLVFGADLCRDSIRRGSTILTIVAADASQNTKKRILDACKYYDADLMIAPVDSAELSRLLGRTGSTMVVALTDKNFADGIAKLFADTENGSRRV